MKNEPACSLPRPLIATTGRTWIRCTAPILKSCEGATIDVAWVSRARWPGVPALVPLRHDISLYLDGAHIRAGRSSSDAIFMILMAGLTNDRLT